MKEIKKPDVKINKRKLELITSPSYLFTIRDAGLLCRMDKAKFLPDFLSKGGRVIELEGKKFIRQDDLMKYQEQHGFVQAKAS
jgi:hypothetical protein